MRRLLVLDTSAYSAFKRGHIEAVDILRHAPRILLPAVSLGELLAGFASGTREQQNRDELARFLESPRVSLAGVGPATAEAYAVVYRALRRAGTPLAANDMWIAAATLEHGGSLLTLDRDYERISGLTLRLLVPT